MRRLPSGKQTGCEMNVAFLQYNPAYLAVAANLDRVEALLDGLDADLVVLPELFASGYFFRSRDDLAQVAEAVPDGPTTRRLVRWAQDHDAVFVAGLPERAGDACYNSAVVVTPQGYLGVYRKVHLFYQEKTLFTPGDSGFRVFDVADRGGTPYRLGVMICFDWYFPESARSLALQGADVIAHPSNLVRPDCPRAMPIRALENHVFTVTANRYGQEESGGEVLTFIGQSEICDPRGTVLRKAPKHGDCVGVAAIDPAAARDRQLTRHNHLFEDRRPEVYVAEVPAGG